MTTLFKSLLALFQSDLRIEAKMGTISRVNQNQIFHTLELS